MPPVETGETLQPISPGPEDRLSHGPAPGPRRESRIGGASTNRSVLRSSVRIPLFTIRRSPRCLPPSPDARLNPFIDPKGASCSTSFLGRAQAGRLDDMLRFPMRGRDLRKALYGLAPRAMSSGAAPLPHEPRERKRDGPAGLDRERGDEVTGAPRILAPPRDAHGRRRGFRDSAAAGVSDRGDRTQARCEAGVNRGNRARRNRVAGGHDGESGSGGVVRVRFCRILRGRHPA